MSLSRRSLLRSTAVLPLAGAAFSLPLLAGARESGSYTSDVVDVTLTWEAPWKKGVQFGNPGAMPILNTSQSGAFFLSFGNDPLAGFPSWEANLDKIEEDYSTGFFVPLRDPDPDTAIDVLAQERTDDAYTILFGYETAENGPACDYYEFRYDDAAGAMISAQLSDLADDFPDVFASLQESVTLGGDTPFTLLDDDGILGLIEDAV